ncbi:MAG: DegT/DnrJ/EryC1/StrS aminotransferase family protein [Desulfamplus sp.]|nr:DegT/DnrJ/EryC1/StrS aminotransferase family protein [Desulfamplus sp.]
MAFVDLAAQQERIYPEIQKRIQAVLSHGRYIMGPEVKELETALAAFSGAGHVITCSSGTDAILMVLLAMEIGPGDGVFVPSFTFVATAEAVRLAGATPVFVDIDPVTFNISPERLDESILALKAARPEIRPAALISVDMFGLPCDYDPINELASAHGLVVIEDGAQSFGAGYKGRMAGTLAHAGCTSFFPAKPLGCYGDGGAIFTDSHELAEKLISIRVHGKGMNKYDNVRIGINGRLDTIQAAILLAKLEIFPDELERRQRVAENYKELLTFQGGFREDSGEDYRGGTPDLILPHVPDGYESAWAQYSVKARSSREREDLLSLLKKGGVPTAIYYLKPLHLQTAFSHSDFSLGPLPLSEDTSSRIFSLPMHPYLTLEEQQHIARILRAYPWAAN